MDVLISKSEGPNFDTTTYRKPTYTGLLTNFTSFTSIQYKIGLVKTLIDRVCKINCSVTNFRNDLSITRQALLKNMFPNHVLRRFFDQSQIPSDLINQERPAKESTCRYFKLPYIGTISSQTKTKLMNVIRKYCKQATKVRLIFTTNKISAYFTLKDSFPKEMLSNVVYQFKCASCNACYIGETTKRYIDRAREHLFTDKMSAVYKYLHGEGSKRCCKESNDETSFSILDSAPTQYQLRIKEALYIQKYKPQLNKQKQSMTVALTL